MEVSFDGHCFGCGPLNLDGLRLTFVPGPDGSVAEFEVPDRFQSWAGMAHGGVVALMLDEAVGWAAWHAGHPGVTGRLQVSYRRPLKLGEPVRIVGKVESIRRTLVYASAVVENRDDGSRIADATATLMMADAKISPLPVRGEGQGEGREYGKQIPLSPFRGEGQGEGREHGK